MLKRNDDGQSALEFYEKRRLWAEYCSTHPDVSDRAFRVGYWLSRRMNGDDQCCWYSVPRIAKEMGRSVRFVRYALVDLRKAGVMLIIEERGKANTYRLRAPFF
ncbi:helix-turn-helix domain-containing protein [Aurantimonas coralicida]|uniref:helix-turn-helix domain-containing protein n=1 Tax=Aurantimonas coralicida TaxID=182270 RepID=UPI001E44666E|nr:helix-turn-helix domain-containing protein [Aurantimonas coralicida]MCD1645288.1 helix-turn-helix domain-containing protein [Aurantimonas coralicida]